MPLGPKLVLAIQIIGLAFTVFWTFTLLRIGDPISIVIQSAILIGLYTRQTAAWRAARWLTAIGAVILSIGLALTAPGLMSPHGTKLWVWAIVVFQTAIAWLFFSLLGRPDSRAYFNAPRGRSNHAMPRRQAQGPELAEGERTATRHEQG